MFSNNLYIIVAQIGNEAEFHITMNIAHKEPRKDNLFLFSGKIGQVVEQSPSSTFHFSSPSFQAASSGNLYSSQHMKYLPVQQSLPAIIMEANEQKPSRSNWGLSLNERIAGKRLSPIHDDFRCSPSFELRETSDANISTVSVCHNQINSF